MRYTRLTARMHGPCLRAKISLRMPNVMTGVRLQPSRCSGKAKVVRSQISSADMNFQFNPITISNQVQHDKFQTEEYSDKLQTEYISTKLVFLGQHNKKNPPS